MSGIPSDSDRPSNFAAFLSAAALALAGLALHLSAWGTRANLELLDQGFGVLRAIVPAKAPDDIVIIALDDSSAVSAEVDAAGPALRKLPDVLARIARGSPRAIVMHAPLPRISLEEAAPGLEDALATALSLAQAAAPLVIGITTDMGGEVMPINDRLLRGVDPRAFAFSLLPSDEDGVVRKVVLDLPTRQGRWPTIAGWLCTVLKGNCEQGIIDYALGPAYRYIPARRLLEIADDKALARLFGARVVFVSQVTGPADRVPQPVSLAGWEPPAAEPAAVLAHAQTVRTLLHGRPVREVPLPVIVLAVAAAALVALVAAPVAPAVGALAAAAMGLAALMALHSGWYLPCAAVLATLLAAVIASRILARAAKSPPKGP